MPLLGVLEKGQVGEQAFGTSEHRSGARGWHQIFRDFGSEMRKLALTFILLLGANRTGAQVSYWHSGMMYDATTSSKTYGLTYNSNNRAGSLLLAHFDASSTTDAVSSVIDSNGNAWNPIFNVSDSVIGSSMSVAAASLQGLAYHERWKHELAFFDPAHEVAVTVRAGRRWIQD